MKDSFLFAAVMLQGDNCREVLSCVLGMEIERVEVCREKNIVYRPEYHGVRLDVYAKRPDGTHFNVEMQVAKQPIERRSRYYHDQMDMEILTTGTGYDELPDVYVIFICDYDPLGLSKYRYTVKSVIEEDTSYQYKDGRHTIFLNTRGTNDSEVPIQLVHFLHFMGASLPESMKDYGDELVRKLQQTVAHVKQDREMGERYMKLEELLDTERKEGIAKSKAEYIVRVLSARGKVSDSLKVRLYAITDVNQLDELFESALSAENVESFEKLMQNL